MRFIICDSQRLQNCVNHISNLPLDADFVVEIKKRPRTIPQNKLFHKWITIIADHCGYDADTMKSIIKEKALGKKEVTNPFTEEITEVEISSASLDKEQFSRLMNETQMIALNFGLTLPSPEDLR